MKHIKLHHFAYNIVPNSLELVLEIFEKLGCKIVYRKGKERWCLIGQDGLSVSIQIIEVKNKPIKSEIKRNTHIAFSSDNPKRDLEKIKLFSQKTGIKFVQGFWSDKELWFDLPDLFVNFVIEIMDTSVVE